jgi:ankyrin repeat protein
MDTAIWEWLQNHYFSIAQPTEPNPSGVVPLILASQQGRCDVVKFLLAHNASLDALDEYGNNALWAACYAQASDCIAALLDVGINLNYQNPSGATALMYTASSGREAVVKQLLAAGADACLQNHDDFTALDLASTRTILKLLSSLKLP